MGKIKLRPISEEEFQVWQKSSLANYALEKEKNGLTKTEAEAVAKSSFAELLPDGPRSKNQFIYSVIEKSSDKLVGTFWWALKANNKAWVYDIELKKEFRGLGYGRETMLLGEQDVKSKGSTRFELHVFGHNKIAQSLYRSLGFQPINIVMAKDL